MLLTEQGVIYKVCSACAISVSQTLSIHNLLLLLSLSIHALGGGGGGGYREDGCVDMVLEVLAGSLSS